MKNIRLMITFLIGLIGVVVYFLTIPIINKETLVDIQVKAGEENVFDGLYLSGDLYEYGSFLIEDENLTTLNELSYLELLDAPHSPDLYQLQQKYPEYINDIYYDPYQFNLTILDSEIHLIAGIVKYDENNLYHINEGQLYLNILDKESNKVTEEIIERQNASHGDQVSVLSLYEEYPKVHILYETLNWSTGSEKSELTFGEYNVETKNYTETKVIDEDGSFYPHEYTNYTHKNKSLFLVRLFNNYNGSNTTYLFNFIDGSLTKLDDIPGQVFIGEDNNLYAVNSNESGTVLSQFNQDGQEIISEVELERDEQIDLLGDYPPYSFNLIDNKLYIFENQYPEFSGDSVLPTLFDVFDAQSGELLSDGEIHYDIENEVNASEGAIHNVGVSLDF